ncbi:hypothetical protein EON76_05245 [bacterium]|nr:MAG: hypothetical protein EON76_05245 [bacterium]
MDEQGTQKFTVDELYSLFPDGLPTVIYKLIFPEKSDKLTIGEIRQIARAIAKIQERAKSHGND